MGDNIVRVMVIAGTADAKELIKQLVEIGAEVVATVTTPFGKSLLEDQKGVEIHQGKMDAEAMAQFIKGNITCLVDASHPFAREASINALKASNELKVPYIRFEREATPINDGEIIRVKNFHDAAEVVKDFVGNIFLAIGSNNLHFFVEKITDYKNRLFVRILPDSKMVLNCEEVGLTAENILAIKGPFSTEMNIEMLKYCKASVLVTKESGETGGTGNKLEAAAELGIPVILIGRPEIAYTRKVSSMEEIIEFVKLQEKVP